jgi:hypothetical protein
MDWIIWLIVIVVIVGVVWWLLNRNSSRSGAGTSTSTGAGTTATPQPPLSPDAQGSTAQGSTAQGSTAQGSTARGGARPEGAVASGGEPARTAESDTGAAAPAAPAAGGGGGGQDSAEWETQWSETPSAEPHTGPQHDTSVGARAVRPDAGERPAPAVTEPVPADHAPVHHPEYTEPHAPTLPGAESAAAELAEADTLQAGATVAATEGSASHGSAPARHLDLDQPYGEGSAAPGPDGSGPEGFTVKGDASSMIYHDETSPSYEETRAEVWFISVAHAEAAGFRPPRRSRL